jgi:hypothetical protein
VHHFRFLHRNRRGLEKRHPWFTPVWDIFGDRRSSIDLVRISLARNRGEPHLLLDVHCEGHHERGRTRASSGPAIGRNVGRGALGLHFRVSVGRYADGRVGEIFLSNTRVNSSAGIMASDSAILCSLLLQQGVSLDVIRRALMRDPRGRAVGPLGVVLDQLAEEGT